jgi:hypothetical protein
LDLGWGDLALGVVLDGDVGPRPFLLVQCDADDGSVGDAVVF